MTETTKNAEMDIKALPRFSVLPDFHTINSISKIKGSLSNTRFPKTVHGGLKKKKKEKAEFLCGVKLHKKVMKTLGFCSLKQLLKTGLIHSKTRPERSMEGKWLGIQLVQQRFFSTPHPVLRLAPKRLPCHSLQVS